MIEIEGQVLPLEPGRTYLLVVRYGRVRQQDLEKLEEMLRARDVHALILTAFGPVQEAVQVVAVDTPTIVYDKGSIPEHLR